MDTTSNETVTTDTTNATEDVVTEDVVDTEEGNENVSDTSEETEYLTIDDLLGITQEDYAEFTDDANHKGMKPLHEWLKHTPEDVRKHVANMRASYTRKTQELAEERKQLEALRQELLETKENTLNNPMLEEVSKYATDEAHDVYSEQGMQMEIKRQAALMMQEMMRPAQEKIAQERRALELKSFKEQHPELTTDEYRKPIAEMLMSRPELSLEDAFYIHKAKVESQKALEEREQYRAQKSSRKESFTKTSTGKNATPSAPPKFRSAWDAYQWHKAQADKK